MEKYINKKIKVKNETDNMYKNELYRKHKWYTYINTQKSEAKFINILKETFGRDDLAILMGDWSKTSIRGLPPTQGKGLRKMFRKHGIQVVLVNEYNTSKKLYKDGSDLEKFLKVKINDKTRLCHGLLRSKSGILSKSGEIVYMIVNRDINAALNIWWKGYCELMNWKIPKYLDLSKNKSKVRIA